MTVGVPDAYTVRLNVRPMVLLPARANHVAGQSLDSLEFADFKLKQLLHVIKGEPSSLGLIAEPVRVPDVFPVCVGFPALRISETFIDLGRAVKRANVLEDALCINVP